LVRLQPLKSSKRKLGGWQGKVKIAAGFDDWSPELDELFGTLPKEKSTYSLIPT
jgi:hypothetical protein